MENNKFISKLESARVTNFNARDVQALEEVAELALASEPTVNELLEQVSVIDTYIYTAKKQSMRLKQKDSTSVAYQFTVGLMEMLQGIRAGLIGDYLATKLGVKDSEELGVLLSRLEN